MQIRQAVDSYVDHIEDYPYRSSDINWDLSDIELCNIDGKSGLEAIVHISGDGICGTSACDNAIVVWHDGQARVIDIINDSILYVLTERSHGMHNLWGSYYNYRWDGKTYEPYCEKGSDSVCENGN